jgi:hypothetical protein
MPVKISITQSSIARTGDGATAGQFIPTVGGGTVTALDLGVLSDGILWLAIEADAGNLEDLLVWRDISGTKRQICAIPPGGAFAAKVPSAPYISSAGAVVHCDYVLGVP